MLRGYILHPEQDTGKQYVLGAKGVCSSIAGGISCSGGYWIYMKNMTPIWCIWYGVERWLLCNGSVIKN